MTLRVHRQQQRDHGHGHRGRELQRRCGTAFGVALSGTYTAPSSNGRGQIVANAGNNSNFTLNGGFALTFYPVDGTTFPFIETDSGQVAAGVFVLQNPTAGATGAIAKPHMFIVRPIGTGSRDSLAEEELTREYREKYRARRGFSLTPRPYFCPSSLVVCRWPLHKPRAGRPRAAVPTWRAKRSHVRSE